jgi:hypothetical protein
VLDRYTRGAWISVNATIRASNEVLDGAEAPVLAGSHTHLPGESARKRGVVGKPYADRDLDDRRLRGSQDACGVAKTQRA